MVLDEMSVDVEHAMSVGHTGNNMFIEDFVVHRRRHVHLTIWNSHNSICLEDAEEDCIGLGDRERIDRIRWSVAGGHRVCPTEAMTPTHDPSLPSRPLSTEANIGIRQQASYLVTL